ncbi:MAG: CvpA family protein [Bacteroidales bacterium]|jgi:membrane protein required for colicin V production|nr:CvpA family protein [Bacteroidales bacterium]
MNLLDIILLVLLVPGTIRGISKGLLEQVVTLIGVVLAVYMAYHFSEPVCTWLDQYINVSETALHVVGFIVMLLGVLIIVMCLAKVLTHVADAASLGWLNRALGFVFAIAVSALILSVLIILFDTLNTKFELVKTPILNESVLYGHLRDLGYFVFPYLKKLLTLGQ